MDTEYLERMKRDIEADAQDTESARLSRHKIVPPPETRWTPLGAVPSRPDALFDGEI